MAQYNQLVITDDGDPSGIVNGEIGYLYIDNLTGKQYASIGGTIWKERCFVCFKDITWEALVALTPNARGQYYNITGSADSSKDYGQIELFDDYSFYWIDGNDIQQGILIK